MKNRTIALAILLAILLSLAIPNLIPRVVFAQTCYDAAGAPIACPPEGGGGGGGGGKKKATPSPYPSYTPTPPPTFTPTVTPTKPALGLSVVGTLPLVTKEVVATTSENPIGGMPAWLFGLLVPAVLVLVGWFFLGQKRKGGGQGKASPNNINFTHHFDKASPQMKPGSDQGFDTDMQPGENQGFDTDMKPGEDGGSKGLAEPHMQPGENQGFDTDMKPGGDGGTTLNNNDGGSSMMNNE